MGGEVSERYLKFPTTLAEKIVRVSLNGFLRSECSVVDQILVRLHVTIRGCPEVEISHRFRFWGEGEGFVLICKVLYNRPVGLDDVHRHLFRFHGVHRDPVPFLKFLYHIQQCLHTSDILCHQCHVVNKEDVVEWVDVR
jgi:hypothetical protein